MYIADTLLKMKAGNYSTILNAYTNTAYSILLSFCLFALYLFTLLFYSIVFCLLYLHIPGSFQPNFCAEGLGRENSYLKKIENKGTFYPPAMVQNTNNKRKTITSYFTAT